MSAPQRLHGKDADALFPRGSNGGLHILARAVLYADAPGVDQRVYDVDHGKAGRGPHAGAVVGADAHRADVSPIALLRKVHKGFLVAPKRVERFLLVQHEKIDVIPAQTLEGTLQRCLCGRPVIAVGLGADDIVRRVLQRRANVGIGAVKVGGVEKADPSFVGVNQEVGALPGGQIALQRGHGQRAEAQLGNPKGAATQRAHLHV